MINIKCPYCNEKLYNLKLKNCPYCYKDISIQSYTFIKIQKEQKEKLKDKKELDYVDYLLNNLIEPKKFKQTSSINQVILLAISLMVVAVIFPIALGLIANIRNVIINATSGARFSDVVDPSVITLLTVLLPIIAIIVVIIFFIPSIK